MTPPYVFLRQLRCNHVDEWINSSSIIGLTSYYATLCTKRAPVLRAYYRSCSFIHYYGVQANVIHFQRHADERNNEFEFDDDEKKRSELRNCVFFHSQMFTIALTFAGFFLVKSLKFFTLYHVATNYTVSLFLHFSPFIVPSSKYRMRKRQKNQQNNSPSRHFEFSSQTRQSDHFFQCQELCKTTSFT